MNQRLASYLRLTVRTEWESYTLEMKPGDFVILGRSPDCRIPIPRASVSLEHLKVTWTGFDLNFEDLNSSNGTFRMPKESPFLSASFGARAEELTLKLSKSVVNFLWEPMASSDTRAEPTATEVAPRPELGIEKTEAAMRMIDPKRETVVDPTGINPTLASFKDGAPLAGEQSKQVNPSNETRELTVSKVKTSASVVGTAVGAGVGAGAKETHHGSSEVSRIEQIKARKEKSPEDSDVIKSSGAKFSAQLRRYDPAKDASWFLTSLLGISLFAISIYRGRVMMKGILRLPGYQLLSGGIHDVMLLFTDWVHQHATALAISVIVILVVLLRIQRLLAKSEARWMVSFRHGFANFGIRGHKKFQMLLLLSLLLSFTWPWIWARHYGVKNEHYARYIELLKVLYAQDAEGPTKTIIALRKFLPQFEGSSLLYKNILYNQRLRVLSECGGVGESATWDQKRGCLVLLEVVAIETMQDANPVFLHDVAQRAAMLLALDGVTRAIPVEGRNSLSVGFFMAALEGIGLAQEKADIQKVIDNQDASDAEVINRLRDLRHRIEIRMHVRQLELNLPKVFYLSIPGPLESGI